MARMTRFKTALLSFAVLLLINVSLSHAQDTAASLDKESSYTIGKLQWQQTDQEYLLSILGDTAPTYTIYELFDPLRLVIDIADASFAADAGLPMEVNDGPVTMVTGKVLDEKEPYIGRLEVLLSADQSYLVERDGNNIIVRFAALGTGDSAKGAELYEIEIMTSETETVATLKGSEPLTNFTTAELAADASYPARMYIDLANVSVKNISREIPVRTSLARIRASQQENGARIVFDSALDELFEYSVATVDDGLQVTIQERETASALLADLMESEPDSDAEETFAAQERKVTRADEFTFSGYTRQRITVDFYKIDLHNVFRLFGEISNLNIVVDEAVKGSLTLALQDVPWDFALDIILNLKDLQKEERYNTIVISPKSADFTWPKHTADKLSISSDMPLIQTKEEKEAISVTKRLEIPKEELKAKKLMHMAETLENKGDLQGALAKYEDAFAQWPENGQIANRISALCLVKLGLNAKAVYYAKSALRINPLDKAAALQAGIGLANMKKESEAREYFEMALNQPDVTTEVLTSYAAFAEDTGDTDKALSLLDQHATLFGDNLDTMISKARIYDKAGNSGKASEEYAAILNSGFEIPSDLRRYIKGRVTLGTN